MFTLFFSSQVLPDRTRVESRFQSFPRTQNHNSQLPPKVPPRVAPKPSRERVLMARKENSVNDVRSDIRRRSNPEIPSRPPPSSQNYSGGMRDERESRFQTMEVELGRDHQGMDSVSEEEESSTSRYLYCAWLKEVPLREMAGSE